ncbi:MAG: hypothetical protein JWQ43_1036 [Glaciihabitans sp.]|nr:hypothetical protein [Glaciihabitans sp.]
MAGAPSRALEDVGSQRIYHVTHVDNLASILESGTLFADASAGWEKRPTVDISAPAIREARRAVHVDGAEGPTVASFVPFSLSPKSAVWEALVAGNSDPRLSAAGAGSVASDFVMLVSTVKHVLELDNAAESNSAVVVTNRDALHPLTRFAVSREPAERMIRSVRTDEATDALLEAELLVEESFSFDHITLIGVANDRARDVVKSIMRDGPYITKVAVYPPWFRPAEDDGNAAE